MADRWATFDCYGTLIDWERGIADALSSLWPDVPRDELLALYHDVEPAIQAAAAKPYREVLAESVAAIAHRRGLPLASGAERSLPDSLPSWPPFPEVRDALTRLRDDGWRIAILSNTDPELLAASLERIGIAPDLTITFADTGSYKPAPGHWTAFFERTSADRDRHSHVAASLFHDVEPCVGLGLRCVWINRKDEASELPRAAELTDLSELPETLARLVPA